VFEETINRDEKSGQEWKLVDEEIQSEFLCTLFQNLFLLNININGR
jgi:hypothetical protein